MKRPRFRPPPADGYAQAQFRMVKLKNEDVGSIPPFPTTGPTKTSLSPSPSSLTRGPFLNGPRPASDRSV